MLSHAPEIAREPDWFFDKSELDTSAATRFRRKVWRRFEREQIEQPVTVRWYDGLRLRLRLGNDLSKCIYVGGAFEPNEFAFLASFLRPGMTVLDVGANEGVYTVFMANRVGRSGRVVACEPSSREQRRLAENVRINRLQNVQVEPVAVGRSDGTTTIAIAGYGHEGQNTIGDRVANANVATVGTEEVPLRRLDTIVRERSLRALDFVKIDAEGSEIAILEGTEEALTTHSPVLQLEIEEHSLRRQGGSPDELLELLEQLGYAVWVFDETTALLRPRRGDELPAGNAVAARRGWQPPGGEP
jgi:FkbM family methyltransferase